MGSRNFRQFSLRAAIGLLSITCLIAAAVHYELESRARIDNFCERIRSGGAIVVTKKQGWSFIPNKTIITHIYLSGTLEISIDKEQSSLLSVKRESARWILADYRPISQVQFLELNATDVGDDECRMLSRLGHLRVLKLAGTAITVKGVRELTNCDSLEKIDLSFTEIGNDDLFMVMSMKGLREVTVEGCSNLSDDSIRRARKEFPLFTIREHRR
jgi:hypothetical protein